MCHLLETIQLNDGILKNMEFHTQRFNHARKKLLGIDKEIDLSKLILIPENKKKGLYRCRVTYSKNIKKIEFLNHTFLTVRTLKLVHDNNIDYQFKYADRIHLDTLYQKRGNFDDIIIVKNGCITDSYTANILLFDGKLWFTPSSPLLEGTQRKRLLEEGKIIEKEIKLSNLQKYQLIGLINAMQDMDNMPKIPFSNVY